MYLAISMFMLFIRNEVTLIQKTPLLTIPPVVIFHFLRYNFSGSHRAPFSIIVWMLRYLIIAMYLSVFFQAEF